jgi:hypothetical protein
MLRVKRTHLVATRTDHSDYRSDEQQRHLICHGKEDAGKKPQASARHQDSAPADPVRSNGHPKGYRCISDQSEGKQQPDESPTQT